MTQMRYDIIPRLKSISKNLLDFLVNWLRRHILNTDKLMALGLHRGAEETLARINVQLEQQVKERTQALTAANKILAFEKNQQTLLNQQLQETQAHLVQSEKMASIGVLVTGVAHEINNPLGYIYSNLHSLQHYIETLTQITELAQCLAKQLPQDNCDVQAFRQIELAIDLDSLIIDAAELVKESLEGATRAKRIVQDLRDFSHVDAQELMLFDLEAGMNATLNIVNNEIKYKAKVVKQYGGLKPFECVGSQINQVFMNLLVNAAQAIQDSGLITIRTGYQNSEWLWVEIEDNGIGMSEDIQARIFDPFFTTKPVGQGTGLGLSLSYKIIQDHHGLIEVESVPGRGSRFRIILPVHPPAKAD
jgi:signal transduction histidine kinase